MTVGITKMQQWCVVNLASPLGVCHLSTTLEETVMDVFTFSPPGAVAHSAAHFGPGAGPIFLDEVDCSGTEANLTSCPHIHDHNCRHSEDAGVSCQG